MIAHSDDGSSAEEHTLDEELIVRDGYPLEAPRIPGPSDSDSDNSNARLELDLLALTTAANVATLNALRNFPAVRAANADMKALKIRLEAARATMRAAQASLEMDIMRRHHAWRALRRRLGGEVHLSAGSHSSPMLSPSRLRRKGKRKRLASELDEEMEETEEAGDMSGVERMLE